MGSNCSHPPLTDTAKHVLVTGGNTGIGFALCQQLIAEHGCHVFMGSRDLAKGVAAADSLGDGAASCSVVQLDVSSDESVQSAAATVKKALDGAFLYAIVNNAGTGLRKGVTVDMALNTNFYGPKRVCDAFIPLFDPAAGRIVNVGSGAAGRFVQKLGATDEARLLMKGDATWVQLEEYVKKKAVSEPPTLTGVYGLSKAGLAAYTQFLAKTHPGITSSCISPGFIDTAMTKGFGATKSPAEGTFSIKKVLFDKLEGNGWYYGSDGVRSPYHCMRNPGEPAYDGVLPF